MDKLVVASDNKGKIEEIKAILKDRYEIFSMREAGFNGKIEETGETFFENALIKAKAVSEALGVTALADDSGLEVVALNNAPGVYSARYDGNGHCDSANRAKLLKEMSGITNRNARFRSVAVLYRPDGSFISGEGSTDGEIMTEEQGTNGFGYDCLFFSKDLQKCLGVANFDEKNSISHRFRALTALFQKI